MRTFSVVPLLCFLGLTTSARQGTEFRCEYSRRTVCDSNGCRALSPQSWYLLLPTRLDPDNPDAQVRVCDAAGCEAIAVRIEETGDLLRVGRISGGYLLTVARATVDSFSLRVPHSDGVESLRLPRMRHGDFLEVNTVGLVSYIGFGRCPAARVPPRTR